VRSERLRIRRFAAGDLDDFLAYQADPVVRRHLPGEPMSREQAADYLAAQAVLDESATQAWHGYAVEHVAELRVIGDVGVWAPGDSGAPGDVGFQFHPGFHGRGYASEAMRTFVPYVFGTFSFPGITATCDPANTSSQALMKRLGMRLIEESETRIRYAVTREEWRAASMLAVD
jgi:[ribosomal protein S5]-alanine N-acetyltransferase